MSFDIFIGCYRDGDNEALPREMVEETFRPFVDRIDDTRWLLRFADGGWCDVYIPEDPIWGFTINRPPGSPAFWDALIDLMKQTDTVLYWPLGGAVVAKESTIAHMPPDMIEAVGRPKVTTDMKEIHAFIEATA